MANKLIVGLVVLLIVGVGGMFLLGNKSNYMPATQTAPQPTVAPTVAMQASPSATDEVMVTVNGSEFKFEPSTLTLKKGQKVKLTHKNVGKYPHDFVIPDLNVKTDVIKPGEETTVEFTPDKAGTFEFLCTVGNHAAMGMKGTVTVQ